MNSNKIDIALVQGDNKSLETLLLNTEQIYLRATYGIDDVKNIPMPKFAVPDFFVVINIDDVDKRHAVTSALTLRNNGHQVFLSSSRDVDDLLIVMSDVYSALGKIEDKTSPYRTEILVTEVTTRVLGDISLIVKDFENKLKKHTRPNY